MTQDATKPHNIFEAASRLEKERREKEIKKQAPPQAAEPVHGVSLSEIFQRCKQLHNEISQSLDQAFKRGGFTHTQLHGYVSRPQNFSDKDWRGIEEEKKKNASMLQNLKDKIGAQKAKEETRPLPPKIEKEEERAPLPAGKAPPKPPTVPSRPQKAVTATPPVTPTPKPPSPPPGEAPPPPPASPKEPPPKPSTPTTPPEAPPPKPPPKKPRIMTRRHWIGM